MEEITKGLTLLVPKLEFFAVQIDQLNVQVQELRQTLAQKVDGTQVQELRQTLAQKVDGTQMEQTLEQLKTIADKQRQDGATMEKLDHQVQDITVNLTKKVEVIQEQFRNLNSNIMPQKMEDPLALNDPWRTPVKAPPAPPQEAGPPTHLVACGQKADYKPPPPLHSMAVSAQIPAAPPPMQVNTHMPPPPATPSGETTSTMGSYGGAVGTATAAAAAAMAVQQRSPALATGAPSILIPPGIEGIPKQQVQYKAAPLPPGGGAGGTRTPAVPQYKPPPANCPAPHKAAPEGVVPMKSPPAAGTGSRLGCNLGNPAKKAPPPEYTDGKAVPKKAPPPLPVGSM